MTVRVSQILAPARIAALVASIALAVSIAFAASIAVAAEAPAPPEDLMRIRYELTGASEEEVLKDAEMRAIRSAIGRVYFTDYMLRARSLLEPYIERYRDKFVARRKVWTSEIRGGKRFMDVEIIVDAKKLYDDLQEKRFVYRPAIRPVFFVFLSETFDGADVEDRAGRKHLLDVINTREYRYLWKDHPVRANDPSIPASEKTEAEMRAISAFQDPWAKEKGLEEACREAQRNEVEVFVAGTIETKTSLEKKLNFDDFVYVESRCLLRLVRSDTGQVLVTAETTVSGAHRDPQQARRIATYDALDKAAPRLFAAFDREWSKTVLDKANVRIMTVGLNEVALDVLGQILRGLAPDVEVYTRCAYADISVFTVSWTGGTKDLLALLYASRFPEMRMTFVKPKGLILENM